MNGKIYYLGACIFLLSGIAWAASALPPAQPVEMNWTRRPVVFSHQAHFAALAAQGAADELCASCHHQVNGEPVFLACASAGCHDNLNPKDPSVRSYFLATHKRSKDNPAFNSCVSCHESYAGEDPAAKKRLTGCRQSVCHP